MWETHVEKPVEGMFVHLACGMYDPKSGHELHKALLAGLGGYWTMAILASALDLLPQLMRFKAQGPRSYFTITEWTEAVAVSMGNLIFVAPFVVIPMHYLQHKHMEPLSEEDPWLWHSELPKMLVCVVVVDVWFYWTHRLIHHKSLYKLIHKFHHRFHAPTSVASM